MFPDPNDYVDQALDAQDATEAMRPKFKTGDAVFIQVLNLHTTITRIISHGNKHLYGVEHYFCQTFPESRLVSEADWHARQAVIAAETEARRQHDAAHEAMLRTLEKTQSMFPDKTSYMLWYIEWANDFWQCGMPEDVRYFYQKYMMEVRPTIVWS
jgi:hypothetical protein